MKNKRDTATEETARAIHQRRLEGGTWEDIRVEFDMSLGVAQYVCEKYGFDHSPNGANLPRPEMWERPCLKCGKPERRGKWLFLCKSCRKENRDDLTAPGWMYGGGSTGHRTTPMTSKGARQ